MLALSNENESKDMNIIFLIKKSILAIFQYLSNDISEESYARKFRDDSSDTPQTLNNTARVPICVRTRTPEST